MIARGYCPKHYQEMFRHDRYLKYRKREINDANKRNTENRIELLMKMNFNGRCQKCGSKVDISKKRAVFIISGKVVCFSCWNENRKMKRFSRKYDRCVKCGTTEGKHAGKGLCMTCYSEARVRQ